MFTPHHMSCVRCHMSVIQMARISLIPTHLYRVYYITAKAITSRALPVEDHCRGKVRRQSVLANPGYDSMTLNNCLLKDKVRIQLKFLSLLVGLMIRIILLQHNCVRTIFHFSGSKLFPGERILYYLGTSLGPSKFLWSNPDLTMYQPNRPWRRGSVQVSPVEHSTRNKQAMSQTRHEQKFQPI